MTSSSEGRRPSPHERLHGAQAAAAPASPAAGSGGYARFIPREEVKTFAAWTPGSFGAAPQPAAAGAQPQPSAAEALGAQLQSARQAGYQDGYRDGLVALEAFKQSYAQQVTAQVATLTQAYGQRLEQLEQGLAAQVSEVAIALARQVVRSELAGRPELVAAVAQEALAATLAGARQIGLKLHPDDHALVAAHAGDALAARGARLVADAAVTRGGVVVESELGRVDASVESRWRRAVAGMGRECEFELPLPRAGEGGGEGGGAAQEPSPQPSPAGGRGSAS